MRTKYNAGIVYNPKGFGSLINVLTIFANEEGKVKQLSTNGKKLLVGERLSISDTTKRVIEIYYDLKNYKSSLVYKKLFKT